MTIQRIKRSAVVGGNQVTIDTPAFITLVKKPANQRAFAIVRSQEDGNVSTQAQTKRVPRTKRSEASADLVRITLPASMDQAAVDATLATFGLTTFTVTRADDKAEWVAQNPSAINCTDDLSTIGVGEGITAHVKRSETTKPTAGKGNLTLTSLEFGAEHFPDQAAVADWLKRNSIDFDEKTLNNPSGLFVLERVEAPKGEEVRLMELEAGVTATLVRSCDCDIPDGFVAVINEYAYCGWGWGQLDFTACLADSQVGDALYEGLWLLDDLYRNILFYSDLPIDLKKELIARASAQFTAYVNGLLDTLPRQLLVSVASSTSEQRSSKEKHMSTTAADPKPTARTEPAADVKPVVEASVAAAVVPGTTEFATAVATAVAAELQRREDAQKLTEAEELKRSEAAKLETEAEAKATLARREELAAIVGEATKPLLDKIAALEGTTVLRSEGGDMSRAQQGQQQAKTTQRGVGDLFVGVFGDIRRSAQDISTAADPAPKDAAAPATDTK